MDVNGDDNSKKLSKHKIMKPVKSLNWEHYLNYCTGTPAPAENFNQNIEPPLNEFQLNQKLEVSSPDNRDFVHLATVVGFLGPRLQLRLDGCDNSNDFFELVDSEAIHPIGTYKVKHRYFAAPLRFRKDAAAYGSFCNQILRNSVPAPRNCFKTPPKRPPKNLFQVGMKLEAVDIKHPSNICPATIVSVENNHVEVHLDGWEQSNDYKCPYYSRHLFPVGWCKKTGHILQFPGPKVEYEESISNVNEEQSSTIHVVTNNNNVDDIRMASISSSIIPSKDDKSTKLVDCELPNTTTKTVDDNGENKTSFQQTEKKNENSKAIDGNKLTNDNIKKSDNETNVANNVNTKSTNKSNKSFNMMSTFSSSLLSNSNTNIKNSGKQFSDNRNDIHKIDSHKYESQMSTTNNVVPVVLPGGQKRQMEETFLKPESTINNTFDSNSKKIKSSSSSSLLLSSSSTTTSASIAEPTMNKPSVVMNGKKMSHIDQSYKDVLPSKDVVESWTTDSLMEFLNLRFEDFHKFEHQFKSQLIDGKAFLLLKNDHMMKFLNIKLGYSLKITDLIEKINADSNCYTQE